MPFGTVLIKITLVNTNSRQGENFPRAAGIRLNEVALYVSMYRTQLLLCINNWKCHSNYSLNET